MSAHKHVTFTVNHVTCMYSLHTTRKSWHKRKHLILATEQLALGVFKIAQMSISILQITSIYKSLNHIIRENKKMDHKSTTIHSRGEALQPLFFSHESERTTKLPREIRARCEGAPVLWRRRRVTRRWHLQIQAYLTGNLVSYTEVL